MNAEEDKSKADPGFPFSPQQALEFMQRMWNPFGMAVPGFPMPGAAASAASSPTGTPPAPGVPPFPHPAAMFAALDPAEVERKIGELRVIEGWLAMSLNMMQMSIKTLELQKASLEALRARPTEGGGAQGGGRKGT
jgi:hypothetical protein